MIYLCYFVFGFIIIQFFVSLINVIFIQKMDCRLQLSSELVSVLIPARNEEKNIANILNDLISQGYKNIEIIVFNDQSTDQTEKIITAFSQKDNRIKLINSNILPEGWLGKNYACHSLAEAAKGDYFLFLDADVRVYNDIISRTTSFLKKHKLSLLSIFPKQNMETFGEKITVPIMNYILLTLLPLILVRKSGFVSLSAANGQFMLFERSRYKTLLPHKVMKKKRVEDIEISRFYKQHKNKIACLCGEKDVTCRMYESYNEAINGFSKNVTSFFANSFVVAIIFWLVTTFGFLPILFFSDLDVFVIYFVFFVLIRVFVSYASNQKIIDNLLYSVIQQFVLGIIILQSVIRKKTNKLIWKNRNISS